MKKLIFFLSGLALLTTSSCKKMEERSDASLIVTKVGNTVYTDFQPSIIDCTSGQTFLVEYKYDAQFAVAEMKYGTDYDADQSQYLLENIPDGATSGVIKFNFVVDELIPEPIAGGIPQYKSLNFDILNEDGVTVSKNISFRKTN
ncbi:MAG: hypothetical protein R2809_14830 [Flavobacteriales bacterium]